MCRMQSQCTITSLLTNSRVEAAIRSAAIQLEALTSQDNLGSAIWQANES